MAEAEIIIDPTNNVMNRLTDVLERLLDRQQDRQPDRNNNNNEDRNRVKLPTFDGTGDVELFITQFYDVGRVCQWTPEVQLLHLREALKGTARDCGRGENVAAVVNCVGQRFGLTVREARTKLNSLKRDYKTTLKEHAIIVERLVGIAYGNLPYHARQTMLIDQFCSTLCNAGLQRHLLAVNADNLDEAVRAGNEYLGVTTILSNRDTQMRQIAEDTSASPNTPNLTVNAVSMEQIIQRLDKLEANFNSSIRNSPRPNHHRLDGSNRQNLYSNPTRHANTECWRCHEKGHIERFCPRQVREQQRSNETGSRQ